MAENTNQNGYDLNAGVIGYDSDHQRRSGEDAITIVKEGENFMKAVAEGDGATTRALNDYANTIRAENGFEDFVTALPEELDGTPRDAMKMEDVVSINDEALRAIAKYGEYANLSPYVEGQNEDLDKNLAEYMTKYEAAREAGDIDAMRTTGALMNDMKAQCGFASTSYANDIATLRAGEGASADDIARLTRGELELEVDQMHNRAARVSGLTPYDEYVPGTNPEMDAQIKVLGDQYNVAKEMFSVDDMRIANDAANEIRLQNGIMPKVSYGAFGGRQDSVAYGFSMAFAFAKAEDMREAGLRSEGDEKQALPTDHQNEVNAVKEAQWAQGARADAYVSPEPAPTETTEPTPVETTITYEEKVGDAQSLLSNLESTGAEPTADLNFGGN